MAEFAEFRFVLKDGPRLRAEVARRVALIAASSPAVSVRLRSGDVEVMADGVDSIKRLGWRDGLDIDVSCTGPGAAQTLREIVGVLDRSTRANTPDH